MDKSLLVLDIEDVLKLMMWVGEVLDQRGELRDFYVPRDTKYYLQEKLSVHYDGVSGKNLDYIAGFVGNKKRWSARMCKTIVLTTLTFLQEEAEESNHIPFHNFLDNTTSDPNGYVYLKGYDSVMAGSPMLGWSSPALVLNEPRVISIKNKISYPNITKARREKSLSPRMPKWLNMKYIPFPRARLLPLPTFKLDREYDRTWKGESIVNYSVVPRYEDTEGLPVKISYCHLAEQIQCVLVEALNLFLKKTKPADPYEASQFFGLIELIYNRPMNFYLKSQDELVGLTAASTMTHEGEAEHRRLPMHIIERDQLDYSEDPQGTFNLFERGERVGQYGSERELAQAVYDRYDLRWQATRTLRGRRKKQSRYQRVLTHR